MNQLTTKSLSLVTPLERTCAVPVFSLIPRFSGVYKRWRDPNRFSGFPWRLKTAEAVDLHSRSNLTPLKRGVNESRSTHSCGSRRVFAVLALGLSLTCSTLHAQNDAADAVSNAVVEAAASIVSNAIVQLSEAASTNEVAASNDIAQTTTTTETNVIDTNNLPGSPQLGPLESRRQWLLRQRAGAPVTNDSGNPDQRTQTNAAADATFRPVKPEFSAFKLVTDRNIFDPNRAPHRPPGSQPPPKIVNSFALVGVMSYGKGTFAFFDGNSSEYQKAVKVNDTVAGYKVTRIEPNVVSLLAGTNPVQLRVGMQLRREEGGAWIPSSQSEIYAANSTPSASAHSDSSSNGADNDILERLRKKREQE
jgi:hypothetical protein